MKRILPIIFATCAVPAMAQDSRELEAHEHGVGELNIAFDKNQIAMELHAPGADIVGFEYEAESAEDKAAVEAALEKLAHPFELLGFPESAGCSVVSARAELEREEHHDEHEDEHHDEHDDEAHDEHDDEHHDDDEAHDEHEDEHHDDDEAHDEHMEDGDHEGEEGGHSEFHAEYELTCEHPVEITGIEFTYFETFENARELIVQTISDKGAQVFEVEKDSPELDLQGKL